jgi:hypothetical protein
MKIYSPKPNNELYKVTNVDAFTSKRLTKKHPLWNVLVKLKNEAIWYGEEKSVTEAYCRIMFNSDGGDFNEPNQTLYIYIDGEASVSITKSLKVFSDKYKTLKGWGIRGWKEMS